MVALAGSILDAIFSFAGALLVVAWCARRFKPSWSKWLLVAPFAKVVVDLVRACFADAFSRSSFVGLKPNPGSFQLGFGVDRSFLPIFSGVLGARGGDHWYSLSLGDLLANAVARRTSAVLVGALAVVVLAVSAVRVVRRSVAVVLFERRLSRARRHASALDRVRVGRRAVDVYLFDDGAVPFTGGVFRPYVAFPRRTFDALSAKEREAALAHELAHVRAFDPLLFLVVDLLGELLWFVPFRARAVHAVHAASERAADESAVRAGVDAVVLAETLVAVSTLALDGGAREGALATHAPLLGAHTLRERIAALLDRPSAVSRRRRILGAIFAVAVAHAALFSNFLTHH